MVEVPVLLSVKSTCLVVSTRNNLSMNWFAPDGRSEAASQHVEFVTSISEVDLPSKVWTACFLLGNNSVSAELENNWWARFTSILDELSKTASPSDRCPPHFGIQKSLSWKDWKRSDMNELDKVDSSQYKSLTRNRNNGQGLGITMKQEWWAGFANYNEAGEKWNKTSAEGGCSGEKHDGLPRIS